jgi:hypothetical protein
MTSRPHGILQYRKRDRESFRGNEGERKGVIGSTGIKPNGESFDWGGTLRAKQVKHTYFGR